MLLGSQIGLKCFHLSGESHVFVCHLGQLGDGRGRFLLEKQHPSFGSVQPVMPAEGEEGFSQGEALSNVVMLEGTAADPKKVLLVHVTTTSERTSTTTTTWLLAQLEGGKLQRLATQTKLDDDFVKEARTGVLRFTWAAGKLSAIDGQTLVDRVGLMDGPDLERDGLFLETTHSVPLPKS